MNRELIPVDGCDDLGASCFSLRQRRDFEADVTQQYKMLMCAPISWWGGGQNNWCQQFIDSIQRVLLNVMTESRRSAQITTLCFVDSLDSDELLHNFDQNPRPERNEYIRAL